jgi:hypothetical protein
MFALQVNSETTNKSPAEGGLGYGPNNPEGCPRLAQEARALSSRSAKVAGLQQSDPIVHGNEKTAQPSVGRRHSPWSAMAALQTSKRS